MRFNIACEELGRWLNSGPLLKQVRLAACGLEKYSALSRSSAASLALLGYAHARSDERKESLQMIDKLISASKQSFVPALFIAMDYAGLEDKDQAFSWLEKAYEERFNRLAYLKVEALWDPIRPDSRFAHLLRRVGIPP